MKLALWVSDIRNFFQHIRQYGFSHSIRATLWRLNLALTKIYIQAQDRFGWYRYQDWIRSVETIQQTSPEYSSHPHLLLYILFSGSSPSFLKDTLDSLLSQSYSNWDTYICVDDSDTLGQYSNAYQNENRIHWRLSPAIPLKITTDHESPGDWLGFFCAGDTFPSDGLAHFVSEIESHPNASIIYSDTDMLSQDGSTRHSPSFWPDWSPELLLSVNYLKQALFRRDILINDADKIVDLEDSLLGGIELTEQIVHIPRVLCHIRDGQISPWLGDNFRHKSLATYLERTGRQDVNISASPVTNSPHVTWSISHPLVSIIILTRDHVALLEQCIESIFSKTAYTQFEIILVENNSQEKDTFSYYDRLKTNPQVKLLIHDQAFNYSAFNNWGVKHSQGDFLLFLNNDIECIDPDWLDEMVRWAIRPDIGVVGAQLLYPNRTIQHAGLVIGLEGHANHVFAGCQESYNGLFGSTEWYRDYSAVTGACMMLPRAVFEQIGGFDEGYSLAFNDVELCMRVIHAGYRVMYTPFARLIHHEGATRSTHKPSSDIKLASQHFRQQIEQGDPFYNPNLSLLRRIPTLRRSGEPSALHKLDQITKYLS
jgi:GT2 family glycosyltransferase